MKRNPGLFAFGLFPVLILFGCWNESTSPTSPDANSVFKSSYKPVTREYWITTKVNYKWDMIPMGESPMTKDVIDSSRRYLLKTIHYVQTDSLGNKYPEPEWQQLSGPIIRATVGDSVL